MKILVLNAGSSSVKYQLFKMPEGIPLCSGKADRIGEKSMGELVYIQNPTKENPYKIKLEERFTSHTQAMEAIIKLITCPDKGVVKSVKDIDAVGHRVVQGGELFKASCIVTPKVLKGIEALIPLAPLHNPANLQGIKTALHFFKHAPSVAVFDTEFHQTLEPHAYIYPLPYNLYKDMGVRRYGFHGISHKYVSRMAARFLNEPLETLKTISCHLGSGASIAAIKNGACIDTSMGFTPMAGLVMGSRCGDIDPSIQSYLTRRTNLSSVDIDSMFNTESGLKGICGMNDMRDIHEARSKGNTLAELAFKVFCYSIRKYIGSYFAALGGVNALVFTAGIGENDPFCRFEACQNLQGMGIEIDPKLNSDPSGASSSQTRLISSPTSRVKVLVVPTNEELEIANSVVKILD